MHYKLVIREVIEKKSWAVAALAKKIGVTRAQVYAALRTDGARPGMTMDSFLRYMRALGARVYVEWTDDGDARRRYRWEIGNE